MVAVFEPLVQRRQTGLGGGEQGSQAQHICPCRHAGLHFFLGQDDLAPFQVDDPPGGLDLSLVSGTGDDRIDQIAEQSQVRCPELGGPEIDLGGLALDLAPVAAEEVEVVGDRQRGGVEIKYAGAEAAAETRSADFLPGEFRLPSSCGKKMP